MKVKSKMYGLAAVVLVIAALAACVVLFRAMRGADEPNVSNELIVAKLEGVSELTTARMIYNGLIHYEEGKIPMLTKKAFFITYQAEVKAGIDLSQVEVNVTDQKIEIVLPDIGVPDVYILPDTIQFYDEATALFNASDKEDALDAIQAAEDDVQANANVEELILLAKNQASLAIETLVADMAGDRSLVIRYR